MLDGYTFASPYWFGLLLLIPAVVYWNYRVGKQRILRIAFPSLKGAAGLQTWRSRVYPVIKLLKYAGLVALIVVEVAVGLNMSLKFEAFLET